MKQSSQLVSKEELASDITGRLLDWFRMNKRELEWRKNPTPYRVWVSEIMLQQTRVEAVKPYYDRFIATLPDIAALANADEELLLKLWEGLGYYRRVRNMHAAAKLIMERHNGIFPCKMEEIRALPGIGDYTAGAIASIAFGQPEPAVDGNVMRVISRITGSYANIDDQKVKHSVTAMLQKLYPIHCCSEFTQSLMELGAIVCLPNGIPFCSKCPAQSVCVACRKHLIDEIPVRSPKAKRRSADLKVILIYKDEKVAVRKRPDDGLLAGLWEFPNFPEEMPDTEIIDKYNLSDYQFITQAKHIFTHVEWNMRIFTAQTKTTTEDFQWCSKDMIQNDIALPGAFRSAKQIALQKLTNTRS